jgi:chromate transporter
LTEIGLFFSKLAVVTFGGAYAVLAYMTQQVVQDHGWLGTAQMMDGLGLAETTPGPLILVTEFVGYLAGYGAGGVALGIAAAALTLWVTFVPCFLWIFAGAPYIDWISTRPRLTGALSAITAAVVGVILNLSLWFATHVFFASVGTVHLGPVSLLSPDLATLNLRAVVLALGAAVLLLYLKWSLPRVLLIAALAGAGLATLG